MGKSITGEWWDWPLSFTAHVELRMEERGVTQIDAVLAGAPSSDQAREGVVSLREGVAAIPIWSSRRPHAWLGH